MSSRDPHKLGGFDLRVGVLINTASSRRVVDHFPATPRTVSVSLLDAAKQMEAMRFCMNRPAEELGDEVEQQDQGVSDSEGEDDDEKGDAGVDGAIEIG